MNKPALLVSALLLGLSASTLADTPPHVDAGMTFLRAVERAVAVQLGIRIAEAELEGARARVEQARALYYPTLDWVSNIERINNFDHYSGITASAYIPELNITPSVAVTQDVPHYAAYTGLQLRYDAYTGGRDDAQLEQRKLAVQGAELSRQLAVQSVAQEVSRSYFGLRRACLEHGGAARRVERVRKLASISKQRLADGRIAAIEERASALALTESESELRVRGQDLDIALADFAATLNAPTLATPSEAQRCRFDSDSQTDLHDAERLSDDTLEARQEQLRLQIARKGMEVEAAALKPQVGVYALYSGIGRSDRSLGDGLSNMQSRQAVIGIRVSVNLFDGGLVRQRMAESEVEATRVALLAEKAADERERSARRDRIRVQTAENRVELARARLAHARALAAVARGTLQSGTGSRQLAEERESGELDAQDELRLAELELVQTRLSMLFPPGRTPGAPFQTTPLTSASASQPPPGGSTQSRSSPDPRR